MIEISISICRFKDVVECDRIVVKAFQSPHEVASFRASKLSDDFYHLKADFERRRTQMTREDMTRDPTRDIMTGNKKNFERHCEKPGRLSTNSYIPIKLLYFGFESYILSTSYISIILLYFENISYIFMSALVGNPEHRFNRCLGFLTRAIIKWSAQSQKQARTLKFGFKK